MNLAGAFFPLISQTVSEIKDTKNDYNYSTTRKASELLKDLTFTST